MAHFAELDENNIVLQVVVVADLDTRDENNDCTTKERDDKHVVDANDSLMNSTFPSLYGTVLSINSNNGGTNFTKIEQESRDRSYSGLDTSMTSYVDDIIKMYVCQFGPMLALWVRRGSEGLQRYLERHMYSLNMTKGQVQKTYLRSARCPIEPSVL